MARNTHQTVLEILTEIRKQSPNQFTTQDLIRAISIVAGADPRTVRRYMVFIIQYKYVHFVDNDNYRTVKDLPNALDLMIKGTVNLIMTMDKPQEDLALWV